MSDHEIFSIIRHDPVEVFAEKLIEIDLGVTAHGKRSMLHMAIAYHRPEHAGRLILRGANPNSQDEGGQTPLHYAAIHGELEVARLLLEHDADISICDKFGNNPLWYAVLNARGQYDLVRLYSRTGGFATRKNKNGKSPLDFARQIGDVEMQKLLISENDNP